MRTDGWDHRIVRARFPAEKGRLLRHAFVDDPMREHGLVLCPHDERLLGTVTRHVHALDGAHEVAYAELVIIRWPYPHSQLWTSLHSSNWQAYWSGSTCFP